MKNQTKLKIIQWVSRVITRKKPFKDEFAVVEGEDKTRKVNFDASAITYDKFKDNLDKGTYRMSPEELKSEEEFFAMQLKIGATPCPVRTKAMIDASHQAMVDTLKGKD